MNKSKTNKNDRNSKSSKAKNSEDKTRENSKTKSSEECEECKEREATEFELVNAIEGFTFTNSANRYESVCDVEILSYAADSDNCKTIVIVTEIPCNQGMSICNAFEELFLQIVSTFELDPERVVWVERWPRRLGDREQSTKRPQRS